MNNRTSLCSILCASKGTRKLKQILRVNPVRSKTKSSDFLKFKHRQSQWKCQWLGYQCISGQPDAGSFIFHFYNRSVLIFLREQKGKDKREKCLLMRSAAAAAESSGMCVCAPRMCWVAFDSLWSVRPSKRPTQFARSDCGLLALY